MRSRQRGPEPWPDQEWTWTDDAHEHAYRPYTDDHDRWTGIVEAHLNQEGEWCYGSVLFDGYGDSTRPHWHVVTWEPLHLEPSIRCSQCGEHGWIRDGRWVPSQPEGT